MKQASIWYSVRTRRRAKQLFLGPWGRRAKPAQKCIMVHIAHKAQCESHQTNVYPRAYVLDGTAACEPCAYEVPVRGIEGHRAQNH